MQAVPVRRVRARERDTRRTWKSVLSLVWSASQPVPMKEELNSLLIEQGITGSASDVRKPIDSC